LRTVGAIVLVVAAIGLPIGSAQSQRLFKYTDENGVTQYVDKIPPQHANRDREVLNDQGVHVASEEGEITEAERALIAQREAEAEAERKAKAEIARHDRMLLETYLSVADIEELRNRRLELLESQIKLTEVYLGNLRKKLVSLQSEASRYKPYATKPEAPQIPENLARELSQTTASISLYEQTLARTRSAQAELRASFDDDIARFRELKGG
jgi:uncharacterized protein (DUF342 family)